MIRPLLKRRYERYFRSQVDTNLFRGVFSDFADALRSIPETKPVGYDYPEPASMYDHRIGRVFQSDYPILFWLSRILGEGSRIFDFGGHIGLTFYSAAKFLQLPSSIRWSVCDVPAVVEAGKRVASERGEDRLDFLTSYADATETDILLTSGALQYVDFPRIGDIIDAMPTKPRHILINKLPLHDSMSYVTVQNFGTGFSPYRIFQRDEFIAAVLARGYELVDLWKSPESCEIPYHPEHSLQTYTGLYFRLTLQ